MRIIHTYAEGTAEHIRLTKKQKQLGLKLAKQHNVVNEALEHSWRAFIRALLNGDVAVEPPPVREVAKPYAD